MAEDTQCTYYIHIGNSDDKLSQKSWAAFVLRIESLITTYAFEKFGSWFSRPDSQYQNACWGFTMLNSDYDKVASRLEALAVEFKQDSICLNKAEVRFIRPTV